MLQVFMTSAELYEYCFPSQELLRLKQLQIKLGDCLNLSDCLSGTCFGPLHRQGCPVKTRPAIPAQTKAQRPGLGENQQTFIKTTQPRAQSPKPSQDQSPEPRAQPRAQSKPKPTARSPEPRKQKQKQNPPKLRTQTLYNFYYLSGRSKISALPKVSPPLSVCFGSMTLSKPAPGQT